MRVRLLLSTLMGATLLHGCGGPEAASEPTELAATPEPEFVIEADRFADIRVLRYQIPGWDGLSLQQKKLLDCRATVQTEAEAYKLALSKAAKQIRLYVRGDETKTATTAKTASK